MADKAEPHKFWVTALAIFTGARVEEIAQLDIVDNIKKDPGSGYWYIDINGRDGRNVKSHAGWRSVPLHPALIDAGFLGYVDALKVAGESKLFPAWKPHVDPAHGGTIYSHAASKWGGRRLKDLRAEGKITSEKNSLIFIRAVTL